MIYEKNGKHQMIIRPADKAPPRMRKPTPEDVRRKEAQRKIELMRDADALLNADLW